MRARFRLLFLVAGAFLFGGGAVPAACGMPSWETMVQGKYEQGLAHMKEARGADTDARHAAYTRAIACFTEARDLLLKEIAADKDLAQAHGQLLADINSCLYWATKFKPLSAEARAAMQEAAGKGKGGSASEEEAAKALEVADSYAARCKDDPFRAASRYYDVVDGFPGTRAAGEALERCRERVTAFIGEAAPTERPDGPREEGVPLPEADLAEVGKLLKQMEKAYRAVGHAQEKRDEIAVDLAELQSRAKRIKAGKKATDSKRQEKEALVEREIPECKEKLARQEKKLARLREEVEETVLHLERFGARAASAVDAYVRENSPDREMLVRLKKLEGTDKEKTPAGPTTDQPAGMKPAQPRR